MLMPELHALCLTLQEMMLAMLVQFMPRGDLWRALATDRTNQLGWYKR